MCFAECRAASPRITSMASPSACSSSSSGPSSGDELPSSRRLPRRSGLTERAPMTVGFPVLSLITWAPFVGALLIMFTARHRPQAVRLIAAISTGVSAGLALLLYGTYDPPAGGFPFYEKLPLGPPPGVNYELAIDRMSRLMGLLT